MICSVHDYSWLTSLDSGLPVQGNSLLNILVLHSDLFVHGYSWMNLLDSDLSVHDYSWLNLLVRDLPVHDYLWLYLLDSDLPVQGYSWLDQSAQRILSQRWVCNHSTSRFIL